MKDKIAKLFSDVIKDKYSITMDVQVERPNDSSHGDYAVNVAMQLSSKLNKNPREIAQALIEGISSDLQEELLIESFEVAGPGFINIKLNNKIFKSLLKEIIDRAKDYGKSDYGKNKQVMVEFGQPNTHKAFHVGHLKSAVSGLSMAKLHENLGFDVIKANYYGDVGMHVAKSTWGWLNTEKPENFEDLNIHEQMRFIDDCYVKTSKAFSEDKEVEAEIRKINKDIYDEVDNEATKTYKKLREISLAHQKDIWKELGVEYDREYPESEIYKKAVEIVEKYKDDVFEKSDGAWIYNGEKEGLTTWVFLTSEGNPTYSAKDLGLAYKKFEEYPNLYKGIVTTSVEIADYFKVVIHLLNRIMPETEGRYFHIPFGWMLQGGRKFSSRMGGSIKGTDILDEVKSIAYKKISDLKDYSEEEKQEIVNYVANAGLKFLILSHEFHKDFSYDPDQFLSFEGFSGPYILYTYARAKSILRKSDQKLEDNLAEDTLTADSETAVLKTLFAYPEVAFNAGINITPHIVANYLYDLSQKFNSFYTELSVLNAESDQDKNARLMLAKATAIVLQNGLNLLGIDTVEKM
ncbi:arginine--tRNA ligase [Candidatus Dojkabacteria bacterium]|uniref:Arginine--tRNA ligase n=1 Tax=Candidatus Dojkabacteria bacterium TaxID=2099670 RepID=A0A955L1A6_9BACT|nr:arginine--tRNA ligase [Candidatus Dojkabacteria bacterium]